MQFSGLAPAATRAPLGLQAKKQHLLQHLQNHPSRAKRRGVVMDRTRAPQSIADALRAALSRLPIGELADLSVWAEWDTIVGATLARHAQPVRMRRGVLVVSVDSSEWMHELQFLKHDLRDRLNEKLGRAAVRDLFLVLTTG